MVFPRRKRNHFKKWFCFCGTGTIDQKEDGDDGHYIFKQQEFQEEVKNKDQNIDSKSLISFRSMSDQISMTDDTISSNSIETSKSEEAAFPCNNNILSCRQATIRNSIIAHPENEITNSNLHEIIQCLSIQSSKIDEIILRLPNVEENYKLQQQLWEFQNQLGIISRDEENLQPTATAQEELCPNTKIRIPEEHDENVPEDSLLQNEYNYTEITETLRDQFDELRRCAMKSTNISPSQTSDLQGAFSVMETQIRSLPMVVPKDNRRILLSPSFTRANYDSIAKRQKAKEERRLKCESIEMSQFSEMYKQNRFDFKSTTLSR